MIHRNSLAKNRSSLPSSLEPAKQVQLDVVEASLGCSESWKYSAYRIRNKPCLVVTYSIDAYVCIPCHYLLEWTCSGPIAYGSSYLCLRQRPVRCGCNKNALDLGVVSIPSEQPEVRGVCCAIIFICSHNSERHLFPWTQKGLHCIPQMY